jgi:hypothetical protein
VSRPDVRRRTAIAAALLVLLALTACGGESSEGADVIPSGQVEEEIQQQIEVAEGAETPELACSEDLPKEQGASITCYQETPDGTVTDVRVYVNTLVDGEAQLGYEIEG